MSSQFSSINCRLITINSQCLLMHGMCFVKTELMILEMRSVENVLLISTPIHQTSPPCLWFQYKLFRQKSRCIYLFTRNENNLHALYSFSYWELYMHFHDLAFIGLLHLIPVPPLSRTSFSKGEISHFFQRGNWEKWKKNALSRGVKKQKCTSRGDSSLFQRGQLHRFFCIPEG